MKTFQCLLLSSKINPRSPVRLAKSCTIFPMYPSKTFGCGDTVSSEAGIFQLYTSQSNKYLRAWPILIFYSISFLKHRSPPTKLIDYTIYWLVARSLELEKHCVRYTTLSHSWPFSMSFFLKKSGSPSLSPFTWLRRILLHSHFPEPLRSVPPHLWSQSTPCFLTFTILDCNYTCAGHLSRL